MSQGPSTRALLGRVPLFAQLSERELDTLAQMARERRFAAGEAIVRQGEGGIGFYLLVEGRARVRRQTEDGTVRELDTVEVGDFFGELALLDEAPRVATVEAVEDCLCLVLPRWEFLAALRTNGELATKLLQALARRMRRLEQRTD